MRGEVTIMNSYFSGGETTMSNRVHAISILFAITCLNSGAANAGEAIKCDCLFEQSSGYVGQGTRAACSAFTEKNKGAGETCQIAFGGTGAQEQQISRIRLDPKEYRDKTFIMTMDNLVAVHDRTVGKIANPAFLREAIPAYMRAAYLRAETRLDDATLADLDKQVTSVSAEFAGPIADVFNGKAPPFEKSWRDKDRLSVEPGAVRFVYSGQISLVAVFFDPRD